MSGDDGSGSGSGRGLGRGALFLQKLLETYSISTTNETHLDSGLGQSQDSPRVSGRGRLMELFSSSDSSSLEKSSLPNLGAGRGTIGTGRGRARLLQSLCQSSSGGSGSESGDLLMKTPSIAIGRGRGKFLEELLKSHEQLETPEIREVIPDTGKKESEMAPYVEPEEPETIIRRGVHGIPVRAVCNYIRLHSDPNKGVFEYEVRFSPNVDSKNLRMKYLNEHHQKFGGTKTFDGTTLYLPILLNDRITSFQSNNPADDSLITIQINYRRKKPLRECSYLYNVLFDRIMKTLNYVRFDRKQYDPTAPKIIPQHRLEIWPGYVTAVDEYEGGVMLCCDVSHRLLCQSTVLDSLKEIYHSNQRSFQENAKKALLGSVILTRYNNKTYRIDDINFDKSPNDTFMMGDRNVTFMEYYKIQYNITLTDPKQPLLISVKRRRIANSDEKEELMFCLMPEICYLTGLRDDLRSDFKVMRDIATFTRVSPNQRAVALQKFYTNVNSSKEAREILNNWGLKLANEIEHITARQLDEEMIIFGRNKSYPCGKNADFGRHATNNELIDVVNLTNWLLIHTKTDMRCARSFIDCLERNSRPMGIQVAKPNIKILENDRTETYVNALRELITPKVQIVVLICPTSRDDRYSAIKKICCSEIPVPSQVINARTLSNDTKNRSIVQKIALQMNCKLGGTLWSINIPFHRVMICGIDSYHDAGQKGNSVAAFVASLNGTFTRWYSRAVIQTRKEEIVGGLCVSLKFALEQYEKMNNYLPNNIIIFRDGVGDGQLKLCADFEIPQLRKACSMENPDYKPNFTFIVVQKRINTRLFLKCGNNDLQNPNPGFVVDHTITRKHLYDFFLVPQSVRQGTVSPTHYVVVLDSANYSPDILQRLSYKLCFLYYNWPGTVRVPACCQYAHKLAYLVGQNIKRPTSEKLADKLFYL